ncbi:Aldehyde/histidinol dehydrogenase [Amanita rubescens]|nr:Aldehyde/histidinol dehydrogenase [Amanita rubescens]
MLGPLQVIRPSVTVDRSGRVQGPTLIRSRGPQTKWTTFMGPVIGRPAYDRILGYVAKAKEQGAEVLIGGTGDDSIGYFIQPTVILTKDPRSVTISEEIFGPVLTVYAYPDEEFDKTVDLMAGTGQYALTGAM